MPDYCIRPFYLPLLLPLKPLQSLPLPVSACKHFLEHRVGIGATSRGAQGVLVIHPSINDDPGLGIEPKKQPKPSSYFGATPVTKRRTHCIALSVFLTIGIARDGLQDQMGERVEKFDVGVGIKPIRVLGLRTSDCGLQYYELLTQTFMEE
jgi:hypothetical protein